MKELRLSAAINKIIVDGTLKGYLEYIEERKKKKEEMTVSGAYAWTRGNHIDDQVAKLGKDKGIVTYDVNKAGYTWEYLQFTTGTASEKYMIIVKNCKRVRKTLEDQKKRSAEENYLSELGRINDSIFQERDIDFSLEPEQLELELEVTNPGETQALIEGTTLKVPKEYSRFYIVTYEIDPITKLVTSIQLTMLNRQNMSLVLVEDLSELMKTSDYQITPDVVEPISDTVEQTIFSGDEQSFPYIVPAEKKEEKQN